MGGEVMSEDFIYASAVAYVRGLTPTQKDVLLILAAHADNKTGECYPSRDKIAVMHYELDEAPTDRQKRTISESLTVLEKEGWIFRHIHAKGRFNNYYLNRELLESVRNHTDDVCQRVRDERTSPLSTSQRVRSLRAKGPLGTDPELAVKISEGISSPSEDLTPNPLTKLKVQEQPPGQLSWDMVGIWRQAGGDGLDSSEKQLFAETVSRVSRGALARCDISLESFAELLRSVVFKCALHNGRFDDFIRDLPELLDQAIEGASVPA